MNTLILNTANENLEIALEKQGERFLHITAGKAHHNEAMLPELDSFLHQHDLTLANIDQFGVVIGPGSFTGIRVGIATIKAFRDSLAKPAKGINNLDYLFALAKSQNERCSTVAICGSRDSYFVATTVLNKIYKYERNLTKAELETIAEGGPIGMFKKDENLNNSFQVELSADELFACFVGSDDSALVPIYYQLSQAESEKIKHSDLKIDEADVQDIIEICKLEQSTDLPNKMGENDFLKSLTSKNHKIFVARLGDALAGFACLELTDEVNIENIVVKKEYRNYGIGTLLIETTKKFAKTNGYQTLSLEVSDNNLTAYLLYSKLGFKLRRQRSNYYADDSAALEMILNI